MISTRVDQVNSTTHTQYYMYNNKQPFSQLNCQKWGFALNLTDHWSQVRPQAGYFVIFNIDNDQSIALLSYYIHKHKQNTALLFSFRSWICAKVLKHDIQCIVKWLTRIVCLGSVVSSEFIRFHCRFEHEMWFFNGISQICGFVLDLGSKIWFCGGFWEITVIFLRI